MKEAIINNDLTKLQKLLYKVDLNSTDNCDGCAPIIYAAQNDSLDIISLFLDATHTDVNVKCKKGHTILMWLSSRNHIRLVEKVLKFPGVEVNAKDAFGKSALMYAAINDYLDLTRVLLSHPHIDVNIKSKAGMTALMYATINGSSSVVKALLALLEIDINTKDNEGYTALIHAVVSDHAGIANQLLSNTNTDVNSLDNHNNSAFIIASGNGNAKMVRLLLKYKNINFNLRGMKGYTALIWAVYLSRTSVIKLLSESDSIDLDVKDNDGEPAWLVAYENNHMDAVSLLENKIKRTTATNIKDFFLICKSAPSSMIKYLMYSGVLLSELAVKISVFNIYRGDNFFLKIKSQLNSCYALTLAKQEHSFPNRINLLVAKICGISFKDDINALHSGMPMPKFLWVSSLMRAGKLTELAYSFNSYMFMHLLLLRNNTYSCLDMLTFDLKMAVISFVSAKDLSENITNLPSIKEVLPNSSLKLTPGCKK